MFLNRWLNRIRRDRKRKMFFRCATVGEGTVITENASISVGNGSVTIGKDCHISAGFVCQSRGQIRVGDRLFAGGSTVIGAVDRIEIGDDVIISNHVHIYDNNNHPTEPEKRLAMTQSLNFHGPLWKWDQAASAPIVIGNNVWIGEYSAILKGVTVGEGSIVAAHAVVTKDVPPYCIAAGNPARVVKRLRPDTETGKEPEV